MTDRHESAEYSDRHKLEARLDGISQLISQKQYSYAETQLRDILSAEPEYHRALELLHNVFHRTDRDQESLELAKHCIQLAPDRSEGYFIQSQSFTSLGEYQAALDSILECTRIEPYNDYYLLQLSCCFYNIGRYRESLDAALQCASYNSNYAYCFYMIGQCHEALKQPQLADEAYYKAIEIDPELSVAHHALSVKGRKQLFKASTLNHAESALRLHPTNKEYEGEYRKAITHQYKLWKFSIWFSSGESISAFVLEFIWTVTWLLVMLFSSPFERVSDPHIALTLQAWLFTAYVALMSPYVTREIGVIILSRNPKFRHVFKALDRRMAWLSLAPVLVSFFLLILGFFIPEPLVLWWMAFCMSFGIMKINAFSYWILNYGLYALMLSSFLLLILVESIMLIWGLEWRQLWMPLKLATTIGTMINFGLILLLFLLCHADGGDRFDKDERD